MVSRFLPENFPVAMPMGLMRKILKGGSLKGPIMKPDLTSFPMRSLRRRAQHGQIGDCYSCYFGKARIRLRGLKP